MIITIDGKDYDWRGEYRQGKVGEHVLLADVTGHGIREAVRYLSRDTNVVRAILHPITVTHTFGGIVFEETGEKRTGLSKGQCGVLIETGNVVIANQALKVSPDTTFQILKPVGIENA